MVPIGSSAAEILAADAVRGMQTLAERHLRADFLFLDPPYAETKEYSRALEFLDGSPLLARSGQLIVEHAKRIELPGLLKRLERTRVVEQGDAALSFYRLAVAA